MPLVSICQFDTINIHYNPFLQTLSGNSLNNLYVVMNVCVYDKCVILKKLYYRNIEQVNAFYYKIFAVTN